MTSMDEPRRRVEATARSTPFTVGVPVYNEEAILVPNTERLLSYLQSLGRDFEVIIGSNGSTLVGGSSLFNTPVTTLAIAPAAADGEAK